MHLSVNLTACVPQMLRCCRVVLLQKINKKYTKKCAKVVPKYIWGVAVFLERKKALQSPIELDLNVSCV